MAEVCFCLQGCIVIGQKSSSGQHKSNKGSKKEVLVTTFNYSDVCALQSTTLPLKIFSKIIIFMKKTLLYAERLTSRCNGL